ncbi:SDR family NAD(P)-dependent oxidoreductase [Pseudoflavitalea rhizosphaerae]|uniref:SDR family NAD(P)-dependent oxidoreductase n=1 Tax=Pseudoflavitalea rhizosphaerae TaxID=1884793 RepID=UPI000F8EF81C|nr:SDR family NAD(P)-dependent oxidoreductase [Pseudoflavitalea rhizosphaerae]
MTYTLITGAGSGLGRAFAVECARRKMNLVLFSLPGSNLESLATELRTEYGIKVQCYEFDLRDADALLLYTNTITDQFDIDFLISNAGIGGTSALTDTPLERIDDIIQLNVRSTSLLTRLLIPHLLKQPGSYILNVSSMAAFTPIAYKTVYPASKAFISSFSLGLREEFAGTGLSVSVLYPGPIMTNSNTSRRIIHQGMKGKMGLLSTSDIARIALKKTLLRYPVIIPGMMNKLNQFLMWFLPLGFRLRLVSKEVKKEMQWSAT